MLRGLFIWLIAVRALGVDHPRGSLDHSPKLEALGVWADHVERHREPRRSPVRESHR